LRCVIPTSECA